MDKESIDNNPKEIEKRVEKEETLDEKTMSGPSATTLQDSNDKGMTTSSLELKEKEIILNNLSDYSIYAKEAKEKKYVNIYTVSSKEMPLWYVDNEYIFKGYRRITNSYMGCVKSLLYLHNETVNIYSHGIGALGFVIACFLFYAHVASTASNTIVESLTVIAFFFGVLVCLSLSTAFHLCCCHSRQVSLLWNKLDYLGIVFLIIGSFVPVMWYGFQCNPFLQKLYISMITVFGLATICISLSNRFSSPQYRFLRTGLFTAMGLSGIAPLVHAIFLYGFSLARHAFAADRIIIMGILYVLGALIYAFRMPERWFPGYFDIWGHSHQIFHILVLSGAAIHFSGILIIYYWWQDNNPSCTISTSDMINLWKTKTSLL